MKNHELLTKLDVISKIFDSSALVFAQLDDNMNLKLINQNYPHNWLSYYCNKRYYYHDPVIYNLKKPLTPFIWCQTTFKKYDYSAQILYKEAQTHDIHSGFSFRFNDSTIISFVSSKSSKDYKNYLKLEKHRILPMLFMVHAYLLLVQQYSHNMAQPLLDMILELHNHQNRKQRSLNETLYFMQALTNEVSTTLTLFPRTNLLPLCHSACERLKHLCV